MLTLLMHGGVQGCFAGVIGYTTNCLPRTLIACGTVLVHAVGPDLQKQEGQQRVIIGQHEQQPQQV